jgi:hypothetical protein
MTSTLQIKPVDILASAASTVAAMLLLLGHVVDRRTVLPGSCVPLLHFLATDLTQPIRH